MLLWTPQVHKMDQYFAPLFNKADCATIKKVKANFKKLIKLKSISKLSQLQTLDMKSFQF